MRLELMRRTELALKALTFLHARATSGGASAQQLDGRVKASEIAEVVDTTLAHVPHVLAPLVSAGWVTSSPGPTGGYRATNEAGSVSLLALIEAVEGPVDDRRCVLADRSCAEEGHCALHIPWQSARTALCDELASTVAVESPQWNSK